MVKAMEECINLNAKDQAFKEYRQQMSKHCKDDEYISPDKLRRIESESRDKALFTFRSAAVFGDEHARMTTRGVLDEMIKDEFERIEELNRARIDRVLAGW